MDYLPIQASSVPSERVFSSSAETDTLRRNRISPLLMEALQMVKFAIKHEDAFDFTADLVMSEEVLEGPSEGTSQVAGMGSLLHELSSSRDEDHEEMLDKVIALAI